ncbi:hypothetical protein IE81DRAFT_326326 [Ceraceosorus guamensis]|uniref:Uncharacterized protein n=1 Tax=Ceraceosorus guamensis TaxID=1522189 RepID=A0A316VPY4_9BASI|nr:hypothetical protein IE81DRAFT_326326 [Ceraceosorus guamensis]PWN39646.1 hypothetical protein IE81DRAFT_326326 [Ceraceosorus guamensis]
MRSLFLISALLLISCACSQVWARTALLPHRSHANNATIQRRGVFEKIVSRLRPILSGRTSKANPTQMARTSQLAVSQVAEAAFPSPRIQHALHDAARLERNTVPMTTQPYRVVGEDGKPMLRLGRVSIRGHGFS